MPAIYAAQQQKYNLSVVYSDCRWLHGKADLVIPLTIFPHFPVPKPSIRPIPTTVTIAFDRKSRDREWPSVAQIMHYHDGCIYNSAKLDPTPEDFKIGDELMGGLYEQRKTPGTLAELLR